MNIALQHASIGDKHILRNLLELCQHDYSEYNHDDVNEDGLFGYRWLDHYWTEPDRHPFLIRVAGKLAGFVLVRSLEQDGALIHSIAEFFVMRKYRRQGVGRQAACLIFSMFPGTWQVCQEEANRPAQAFWRRVIAEYTEGMYSEQQPGTEEWHGPCQSFQGKAFEP